MPVHADKLTGAAWFKSSHSDGAQGCIEVADLRPSPLAAVALRDSKVPDGPALVFPAGGWSSFVARVKGGGLGAG
ncbi:DUF397 domain-containing protein [Streptomyces sp. NPDC058045]|uniref:DUF397 domain-containing protein n=1 Tax=Streptomyces sp. NPDC058045 TaxID=3346311 RepID=UPI0036EEC506